MENREPVAETFLLCHRAHSGCYSAGAFSLSLFQKIHFEVVGPIPRGYGPCVGLSISIKSPGWRDTAQLHLPKPPCSLMAFKRS